MFTSFVAVLQALNSLTPLGVIALLIVVILLMVHKDGPIKKLSENHLSHVQQSLDALVKNGDDQLDALKDQSRSLNEIKSEISFVKGIVIVKK